MEDLQSHSLQYQCKLISHGNRFMVFNMCISSLNINFTIFSLLSFMGIKPEVIHEVCGMVSYYSSLVIMFAVNVMCRQHLFNTKPTPNLGSYV